MRTRLSWLLLIAVGPVWAQADPPARVARLNFLEGSVSLQQAGHDDWIAAVPNYPLTTGDHLWADERSRAELHIGSTAIRLDAHTALAFLNLDDRMTQIRLSDGTLNISIRRPADDESFEVDTPNGAISLLRPGTYRVDADPDRQLTTVTVRSGEAEVTAGGAAFPVHARQSAFITGTDQPNQEVAAAQPPDDFDRWWQNRDEREARRPRPRYVSEDTIGYEDLDEYGYWRDYPAYGPVWCPHSVVAGWAPYRFGHWVWVDPWGWTWVDDAPWGFAPFHYGRWVFMGGVWGWVPGRVMVRPVYAPALVVWVGGRNWGVSLAFGAGGGIGWFPLGPREPYIPSYRVSNNYITRVNVTHVTNVTNITTNVTYMNHNVPGAVTAVSRTDFAASRHVASAAVDVPPSAVASAPVTTQAVPVPRQEALAERPVPRAAVARPSQAIVNAPVVTRTPPPASTLPLARPAPAIRPPTAPQPAPASRPAQPEARPPTPIETRPSPRPPEARPRPIDRPPAAQPPPPLRPPMVQAQPPTRPEGPAHTHGGPPPSVQRPREERRPASQESARPQREKGAMPKER